MLTFVRILLCTENGSKVNVSCHIEAFLKMLKKFFSYQKTKPLKTFLLKSVEKYDF
jgi:hypothetical protein